MHPGDGGEGSVKTGDRDRQGQVLSNNNMKNVFLTRG
jgi:hypothetical protein